MQFYKIREVACVEVSREAEYKQRRLGLSERLATRSHSRWQSLWLLICHLFLGVISHAGIVQAETTLDPARQTYDKIEIRVGGYDFPPFVSHPSDRNKSVGGLTLEMIKALNQLQNKYNFSFFETTSKRRYLDFEHQRYDAIFFESLDWGWKDAPVLASNVFLKGGEVYIAMKKKNRDQHFFDELWERRLVGVMGYHYGFANFNADEEYLSRHFKILLSSDHLRNIRLILIDRPELAEVAVVTRSYLSAYLREHPEDKSKLMISDKMDQHYHHTILVRENGPLPVSEINRLLDELTSSGEMRRLTERYGIDATSF